MRYARGLLHRKAFAPKVLLRPEAVCQTPLDFPPQAWFCVKVRARSLSQNHILRKTSSKNKNQTVLKCARLPPKMELEAARLLSRVESAMWCGMLFVYRKLSQLKTQTAPWCSLREGKRRESVRQDLIKHFAGLWSPEVHKHFWPLWLLWFSKNEKTGDFSPHVEHDHVWWVRLDEQSRYCHIWPRFSDVFSTPGARFGWARAAPSPGPPAAHGASENLRLTCELDDLNVEQSRMLTSSFYFVKFSDNMQTKNANIGACWNSINKTVENFGCKC